MWLSPDDVLLCGFWLSCGCSLNSVVNCGSLSLSSNSASILELLVCYDGPFCSQRQIPALCYLNYRYLYLSTSHAPLSPPPSSSPTYISAPAFRHSGAIAEADTHTIASVRACVHAARGEGCLCVHGYVDVCVQRDACVHARAYGEACVRECRGCVRGHAGLCSCVWCAQGCACVWRGMHVRTRVHAHVKPDDGLLQDRHILDRLVRCILHLRRIMMHAASASSNPQNCDP